LSNNDYRDFEMRLGIRINQATLEKARDLSKLTPKTITNKNGHRQTVYVRLGLPMKGNAKTEKDNRVAIDKDSTEQAHELTLDMFGTLEEVREIAKTVEQAQTRDEARNILKNLIGKPLKSRAGIEATISNNSIEKILSGKASDKSYNAKAHFLAVANLEKLFSNAIEPFKFPLNPDKRNENYKEVRRMYAPMAFEGRIIPVKFTVMVMMNEIEGKRIYSLEAIDVDLERK
jgi:hypothetical protein